MAIESYGDKKGVATTFIVSRWLVMLMMVVFRMMLMRMARVLPPPSLSS